MHHDPQHLVKLHALMDVNHEIEKILGQPIYDPNNLFDLLMNRLEKTPAFLDYTFEVIISMIEKCVSIHEVVSEYQRLLQLNSLSEEFKNPNQWNKVSNF